MEHIIGWEGSEMVSVSGQTLILIFCWRISFLLFFLRCFLNGNSPDKEVCSTDDFTCWTWRGYFHFFSWSFPQGVNAASFSHQPSRYQVKTRARVIMFDVAGFQTGRGLQIRSYSLLSHSMDHASRSFSRELGGLMSWPESTYKAMQCRHDGEQVDQQETNMSTRAMQLNIFGSMISNTRRRPRSFPGIGAVKTSHGLGYRKLTSHSQIISRSSIRSGIDACFCEVRGIYQQKGQVQGDNEDIRIQLPSAPTEESHTVEDSSDDSGGEDEHLIRIDSGRPSFPQWITEEDKAS